MPPSIHPLSEVARHRHNDSLKGPAGLSVSGAKGPHPSHIRPQPLFGKDRQPMNRWIAWRSVLGPVSLCLAIAGCGEAISLIPMPIRMRPRNRPRRARQAPARLLLPRLWPRPQGPDRPRHLRLHPPSCRHPPRPPHPSFRSHRNGPRSGGPRRNAGCCDDSPCGHCDRRCSWINPCRCPSGRGSGGYHRRSESREKLRGNRRVASRWATSRCRQRNRPPRRPRTVPRPPAPWPII